LDERLSGIWNAVCGTAPGETYCTVVDRAAYEGAALALGEAPETPRDPDGVRYWACYDHQSQAPRCAFMAGAGVSGETTVEPAETPSETATTEPAPTESAPGAADVDLCSLLPVDDGAIVRRSDVHCVASIDALLGCDACGSEIAITRVESAEQAEQIARDAYCGNPNFTACAESPIGDAGITSTDTSGEEYRPEVAFAHFRMHFSHGRYVVDITAEIPGKEDLVIGIGQEVIERIDASQGE
jgi:hypothetical protein